MNNNVDRNRKLLAVTIVAALLLFIGYSVWAAVTFRVTKVFPGGKKISTATPYIDIHVNHRLGKNTKEQISANPDVILSVEFSEKKIRINLSTIEAKKKYTIRISEIASEKGKLINKAINFTATDTDFDKLPKDQREAIVDSQDNDKFTQSGIHDYLPYGTTHFALTASPDPEDNNKPVVITAELLLSKADLDDRDNIIAIYRQEVIDYLNSVGLQADNFNIQYEVVEPSLY